MHLARSVCKHRPQAARGFTQALASLWRRDYVPVVRLILVFLVFGSFGAALGGCAAKRAWNAPIYEGADAGPKIRYVPSAAAIRTGS
jgi:hypothetical protein